MASFIFTERVECLLKIFGCTSILQKQLKKDGKFRFAKYWLIDLLIDWLVGYDKIDKMTATNIFLIIIVQEMP